MNKKQILFGILIVALLLEIVAVQGEREGYRRRYGPRRGPPKQRRRFKKNGRWWECEDTRGRGRGMGSSSADTSDDLSDSFSNECFD